MESSQHGAGANNPDIDLNIDNYTVEELTTILDLNEEFNENDVVRETSVHMNEYAINDNPVMLEFFTDIQNRLLVHLVGIKNENESEINITEQEYGYDDALTLVEEDDEENEKLEENDEDVGVKEKFNVTDTPYDMGADHMKVLATRSMVIDSRYRKNINFGPNLSTDYTIELSEKITSIIELQPVFFQIPYTWYNISSSYANNFLWISHETESYKIEVESGVYIESTIVDGLNTEILKLFTNTGTDDPVTYSQLTHKVNFNLSKLKSIATDIMWTDYRITFFISPANEMHNLVVDSEAELFGAERKYNATLGWMLGFRTSYEESDILGNCRAPAVIDMIWIKYFVIAIDDFNKSRINNALIGIGENVVHFKMPEYYNVGIPSDLTLPVVSATNEFDHAGHKTGPFLQVKMTAPRILTQSQLRTINEISKTQEKKTKHRHKSPVIPDVFCVVPIKHGDWKMGGMMTEYNQYLKSYGRTYFGPVDIDRLKIQLFTDKGILVDLNGADWVMGLKCKNSQ